MKYLLDSSFVVALLSRKDVWHEEAKKMYEKLPERAEFYSHFLVEQETLSVLSRRSREKGYDCTEVLQKTMEFFEQLKPLQMDPEKNKDEIIEIMNELGCKLSFVDAFLLVASKKFGLTILTLDNELRTFSQ